MTTPDLRTPPSTDPALILRYRDRQYAAELLAAAIVHLDLFTWLDTHPGINSDALRAHFNLSPRPTDVLLTLCRASGYIRTDDRGQHTLTRLAEEHLVKTSPWFLGPYYTPIQDSPIVHDYLKVLKTGKPANWQAQDEGADWHASMLSETFAREFTALMNCRGRAFGQVLAQAVGPMLGNRKHLFDIGGGSGIYTATLLAAHDALTATILEQTPVDAIAREEIAKHGLSHRADVLTGDMFADPWPDDADVILMSNLLHDWDFPEVRTLLAKAAATLKPGGLLVIHEVFIDNDKAGPLPAAEYSALLMCITQGKCYSPGEYGAILSELGFEVGAFQPTIADRGFMTAIRK
jgi:SAM-dependent methyltransferase